MRWILPKISSKQIDEVARTCGTSHLFAQVLVGRKLTSPNQVAAFLAPTLAALTDPLQIGGMQAAVERVRTAVRRNESVLVFGDYDVDGVTSTTLLVLFLREFALSPRFIVPRRLTEGYGLSIDSLDRALAGQVPDLLIAVDCGTSSASEVAHLRTKGIDVLIIDHHTSKEALPQDCILVNPHVHDPADAPWSQLSAVGLVFKFCHAFLKVMRREGDPKAEQMDLREHMDLVALGTVSDLVQLTDENRILVHHGLRRLQHCRRPGLCALMEITGLSLGEQLDAFDIGFRIGPRINASGRLEDATLPIELLLASDWDRSRAIARELDELNRDRQLIERAISEDAESMVERKFASSMGLVLESRDWHTGVVGIVASRISRKYHRPTIVLGEDTDGLLKGSGRSVEGVDLVKVLQHCNALLEQWGGHPMAVGLCVQRTRLEEFRAAFNQTIAGLFPDGLPEKQLHIDAMAEPAEFNEQLLTELERLAPFGQGHGDPVFCIRSAILRSVSRMGGNGHLRFSVLNPDGRNLDGVAWGMADNPPPLHRPVDIAFRFGWNSWRGTRSARLTLIDWR